ncbi:MAG TPA: ribonuclease HII [Candidatus Marinimicrobia bacterium]|nr:ribonuclease HII [Candidatus Neomarinimicrobiota bacterium]HRS52623.1 ribonuclease HII [Candidatus Neomarinimicrobiota bacterium]HRU92085.1 ribonuclease HII [Candidatus Neomarinimicrobiota bacterium]
MKSEYPTLEYEKNLWEQGISNIAGIDEAGRGPLAGPVVAAAVVFSENTTLIPGINDSKQVTPAKREKLYDEIMAGAQAVGIGLVEPEEIDRIDILQATYKAMRMAIGRLKLNVQHILVDGRPLPDKIYPQTAIVGGDRKCYSIAAASIIAKVYRDRLMRQYDSVFPGYGFAQHKGYGTKKHLESIVKLKPCPIHRISFQKVTENIVDINNSENTRWLGKYGEDLAALYLFRHGYQIIKRNFHLGAYGEIDIIAQKDNNLCFVEVKTQRHTKFGPPESWVDERKMQQIGRIAAGYLSQNPVENVDCRFDVVTVNLNGREVQFEHWPDAFRL